MQSLFERFGLIYQGDIIHDTTNKRIQYQSICQTHLYVSSCTKSCILCDMQIPIFKNVYVVACLITYPPIK